MLFRVDRSERYYILSETLSDKTNEMKENTTNGILMFSLLKLTLCFLKISEDAWQLVLQFPEAFIPSAKYFSLLYQTDILLQEGRLYFFFKAI